MYELLKIFEFGNRSLLMGKNLAIATIYNVEGSSYRKKWTQMMIAADLSYAGHLSGGCVEKEIIRHAESCFRYQENASFDYDGSFRLGCEGIISIQIELIDRNTFIQIYNHIKNAESKRWSISQGMTVTPNGISSSYHTVDGHAVAVSSPSDDSIDYHTVKPQNQLVVIGSEFDSNILCRNAHLLGYKVVQIVSSHTTKEAIADSDWHKLACDPDKMNDHIQFDTQTAVILMTHSYHRDLQYILPLIHYDLAYLGTLGPTKRKLKLVNYLTESNIESSDVILDRIAKINGPVGLDIPSCTPEEISISILAELIVAFSS